MEKNVKTIKAGLPVQAGDILPAREAMEMFQFVEFKSPIPLPELPKKGLHADILDNERTFLHGEIKRLAKRDNVLILAHNYEDQDVQDAAHYVGDSLHLAKIGRESKADFIVEASVLFMLHVLAVMKQPHQVILAPDLGALCSLAAHADAGKIRAWKSEHHGGIVVSYINTYLDVKAESDYCCTSANTAQVIQYAIKKNPGASILFLPDVHLGIWAANMLEEMGEPLDRLYLMMGACHVHDGIRPSDIAEKLEQHPDADLVVHPECGCTSACMTQLREGKIKERMLQFRSTQGMFQYIKDSSNKKFIMATEVGNEYAIRKAVGPGKEIIPASDNAICAFMKQNTLRKLYGSIRDKKHVITVDSELARRARLPIERMLAIL